MTTLKEIFGDSFFPSKEQLSKWNCKRCYDTGLEPIQSGPDDVDMEACQCDHPVIEKASDEYMKRANI
mgnify:CR=1 FL=1